MKKVVSARMIYPFVGSLAGENQTASSSHLLLLLPKPDICWPLPPGPRSLYCVSSRPTESIKPQMPLYRNQEPVNPSTPALPPTCFWGWLFSSFSLQILAHSGFLPRAPILLIISLFKQRSSRHHVLGIHQCSIGMNARNSNKAGHWG